MNRQVDNIIVENAHIIWKNFAGEPGPYNRSGDRSFTVVFEDPQIAQELLSIGWNVRMKEPKEEGDIPFYTLQVAVKYDFYPPNVFLVNGKKKELLDEESVKCLDYARIENADVVIRPYCWEAQGKEGIKAYLKTGYFTIEEDPFAYKYDD